jgi:large subunit ribosomal protein L2
MLKYLHYFFLLVNKKYTIGSRPKSGRNFSGTICVHHKSGKNKNQYYFIDFYRRVNDLGFIYKVLTSQNRTAFLGAVIYQNGLFSYILLSETLKVGSKVYSGTFYDNDDVNYIGITIPMNKIRLFSLINNIEKYPYSGGSIVRAAGTCAILTSKLLNNIVIKLKSGWNLILSKYCLGTVGNISNMKHKFDKKKKAGVNRNLGIRPTVRGVAMNPCDHPHGGGEGRKSPPSGQRSPWGWLTKGTSSLQKKYQKKKKKLFKEL